jgi:hypothetical protein
MTNARGGMCQNPFGHETRIDRINLLEFLEPNKSAHKVLYSCIIQDAVSNYLYAFLGKNGTSTEEFFAAWQYFFKIISTDKAGWDHNRIIKQRYTNRGQKITNTHYLTDNELKLMCFDKHYEYSGLSNHMNINRFRAGLKTKRRKILTENWEQVTTYINQLYQYELNQIADKQQIPLQVWNDELLTVLIDPPSPLHLANVIYVQSKLKRTKKPHTVKTPSVGVYHLLVDKIINNKLSPLGDNWGPLAELGIENDKAISNSGSNSICCNPH